MRILVLNADYPRFLTSLYRRQPGLENAPYATQMAARNASLFGVADFYSKNFAALGHPAAEIHVNNPWLQSAWAHEHGMAVEPPEARRRFPGPADFARESREPGGGEFQKDRRATFTRRRKRGRRASTDHKPANRCRFCVGNYPPGRAHRMP